MTRIFQKHGKIMLTALGIVLMIVFALPSLSGSTDNSSTVVGKLNGKKVTVGDLVPAGNDIEIVKLLLGGTPRLDDRDPRLHWMLELQEAKRYGFDTESFPEGFITDAQISAVQSRLGGVRRQDVYDAANHLIMIQELRKFVEEAPMSMASLELAADQEQSQIKVAYATFDAAMDWKDMPVPADEQIKKQFDLYKDVVRTPLPTSALVERGPEPKEINGHHYPFGYKYPDRVSVEYIVFDRNALRDHTKPALADYEEAYAYYKNHPEAAEFKTGTTNPGVVGPAPIKSFDEVRDSLVQKQIEARVDAQIKAMQERAMMKATEPWKTSDAVPAAQWVKYADIVADLGRHEEDYKPTYKAVEKLMGPEELAALPEIGKASNPQGIKFAMLATHVKELIPDGVKDSLARLGLQVGVDMTLHDDSGNLYMFRVTGVEKAHDPATLDEVKGQVVDDLKMQENFERVTKAAKELADAAKKSDLSALAKAKRIPESETVAFSQAGEIPLELKTIHDFVKQAFTMVPPGAKAAASQASTAAASQAALHAPGVGDTTTLNDDSALRAYAMQLKSVTPAAAQSFGQEVQMEFHPLNLGPQMQMPTPLLDAARQDTQVAFADYLSLENLMKRLNYQPEKPYTPHESGSSENSGNGEGDPGGF